MKFTLTIEGDNYSELQRIAAVISGADATENNSINAPEPAIDIRFADPAPMPPPAPPVSAAPTPPAPPVSSAPVAPVAEPAGDNPDVSPPMYDRTGMPWDKRIHSESRSQNADGTWRKRRGVDQAIIQHVEAELRGSAAPAAPTLPPAPSAPAVPPPPAPPVSSAADDDAHAAMRGPVQTPGPVPPGNYPSTIQAPPAPASQPIAPPIYAGIPTIAPIAPPPAAIPTTGELNMSTIMMRVGPAMTSGKLTQNDLAGICAEISKAVGKTINSIVDCINDQNALQVCSDLLTARGI